MAAQFGNVAPARKATRRAFATSISMWRPGAPAISLSRLQLHGLRRMSRLHLHLLASAVGVIIPHQHTGAMRASARKPIEETITARRRAAAILQVPGGGGAKPLLSPTPETTVKVFPLLLPGVSVDSGKVQPSGRGSD
mmetsp:Transcript_41554/g.96738  ORF Transcript_41554/g.96738 Transcript_41554/m.96738 type:complete len:138 (-) Transcript_41554:212-625(-)